MGKEPGFGRSNALEISWDSGIEALGPPANPPCRVGWIVPVVTMVARDCRVKNFMNKDRHASIKFNRLTHKGQIVGVGKLIRNQ